ncbi:MAG: DUF1016 N-terminal domain-containing protein [Bacteroidota bacterium]|nr:DUF1016 N-terminal domain-containing protein [Bacteroidota bacterium]
MSNVIATDKYVKWINSLKVKIHKSKIKIALSINSELLELYWDIGKEICQKQEVENWGSKIIEKVAVDLKHEFPEIKGFSRRNIYAMRQWFLFYSDAYSFVPQAVAQIPWGHNRLIISKRRIKLKQNMH